MYADPNTDGQEQTYSAPDQPAPPKQHLHDDDILTTNKSKFTARCNLLTQQDCLHCRSSAKIPGGGGFATMPSAQPIQLKRHMLK